MVAMIKIQYHMMLNNIYKSYTKLLYESKWLLALNR